MEILHPPGHPVTTVLLSNTVKEGISLQFLFGIRKKRRRYFVGLDMEWAK
jgi:hypothetical protein